MSESGTHDQSAPRNANTFTPLKGTVDIVNEFDFDRLRRRPDIEAENLFAVDASDRLILDEAAGALAAYRSGGVVVLEDRYGALTLGAAALHNARGIRVYQDALSGEYALDSNASGVNLTDAYRSLPLGEELLKDAHVVLLQLPKSLDELDEIAGAIAKYAAPDVIVFAGGRIKHMTVSMNEVLRRHFGALNVRPARQKSRVLIASSPLAASTTDWPHSERHEDFDLTVRGHGGVFAGTSIDIGTRALLEVLDRMKPDAERAVDLGCGTGVLAAALAAQRPLLRVLATDQRTRSPIASPWCAPMACPARRMIPPTLFCSTHRSTSVRPCMPASPRSCSSTRRGCSLPAANCGPCGTRTSATARCSPASSARPVRSAATPSSP